MKEVTVEQYLREQVEFYGGLCEKHVSPGRRDVPDRLVTWFGFMDLVETKAPGKQPRLGQRRDHARRRRLGIEVWVISTRSEVDFYIAVRTAHMRK